MNVIALSSADLAIATSLVLIAGAISFAMRLGVTQRLAIAALRTVVQLALLGLVLEWVFDLRRWYLVLAVLASMILNAGIAAVRRTEHRFAGIWQSGLIAVTTSSVLTTFVVVELVIRVDPWYEPRYVIPILGMVLGNTLTGISLSFDRLMNDLDDKRDQVEGWLALGATHWEACRPFVRTAISTGLIPILNSMTVVGIVSLPGMMTGQILAGSPPGQAVKYQIVVMFMIASSSSIGAYLAAMLGFRRLVTSRHQLAHHRLRRIE
jgi:putative ABC transport system permease protein